MTSSTLERPARRAAFHPGSGMEGAELEEVAVCITGWRVRVTQLAPGPCSGGVRERVLPSLRLLSLGFSGLVALSAEAVAEAFRPDGEPLQVGILSSGRDGLVWDARRVGRDHLAVKDGGDGSNIALPGGCRLLLVRLDRLRLEALARVLQGGESEPWDRPVQLHRLPGPSLDELRDSLDALATGHRIERAEQIGVAERDVYQRLALALASPREPSHPSLQTRRRALRRAEEYMRAHARDRISLSDVCAAVRCSERTLRYAFQERYGVSPMALLKRVRLQGLRRDLRNAAPRSTTVLDLALRWGFWHLGHLGRDYKAFFGETPAASLARTTRPLPKAAAVRRAASLLRAS